MLNVKPNRKPTSLTILINIQLLEEFVKIWNSCGASDKR